MNFKEGDMVVVVPSERGPNEIERGRYGRVFKILRVDRFKPDDIYYSIPEGGCYHSRENALVLADVYFSPLYQALL